MKKYNRKIVKRALCGGVIKTAAVFGIIALCTAAASPIIERGYESILDSVGTSEAFAKAVIRSETAVLTVKKAQEESGGETDGNVIRISDAGQYVNTAPAAGDDSASGPENEPSDKTAEDGQYQMETGILTGELMDSLNAKPITAITIAPTSVSGYTASQGIYIKNETKYDINIDASLSKPINLDLSGEGPHVLILHTHGSEAYSNNGADYYMPEETNRSEDKNENVVAVGAELARVLKQKGISVIHLDNMYDIPDYNSSYSNALKGITEQIKNNENIKIIIDIHRDAMVTQSGTKYKTVTEIDGKDAAQVMFVCGSDEGSLPHSNWQQNLRLAIRLQSLLNQKYPGLMRPINLRTSRFNQHVSPGSMLVEMGTSGNTLDEALYSAQLFGSVLGDFIAK